MEKRSNQLAAQSRREFIKTSSALGMAAWAWGAASASAAEAQPVRIGLIGCGRRGSGAVRDCIDSSPNVSVVALGDVFPDKIAECKGKLSQLGDAYKVTDETCFAGFDAFQKVLQCDVNYIILATPPAFRAAHLKAALEAGKHVFSEKPVAVDPVGIRSILESSELAKTKGLGIVAGTQRRHQANYLETITRIHDGAIGDIVSAECYWIGDYSYYEPVLRQPGWSDMEWQLRNWNYFTWLSGDHIVEQHVHNIDVMNWVLKSHPIKAMGMGGRQQRTGPEFGHIYDHFAVEFEYPNGVRVTSMCRQNAGTYHRVNEWVVGTKGTSDPAGQINAKKKYKFEGKPANPYVQEHADLIASIRAGKPLNEGRAIAESTMAAIIGRLAAYTGQEVTWQWAMEESKLDLSPARLELGELPDCAIAIPGYVNLI
ncbi:MAG: Gfo/Idh/MocA family oxidoreductase [Candidatus Hydrogenedentes bacterium]|nr:Gfo/Idh/MocA family oxidoreductase [Candidatus Hydrogenedentota bacterium]